MMGRRCYVLLRRRYDVPIRRRGDVPLRRLGDVASRRRWVFHLSRNCDVAGTYRETSLRHRHDVLMPGGALIRPMFCTLELGFSQIKTKRMKNNNDNYKQPRSAQGHCSKS